MLALLHGRMAAIEGHDEEPPRTSLLANEVDLAPAIVDQ